MHTDWNNVALWYDEYLKGDDTYQAQVIARNLVRMLGLKKGDRVLDVACGQGYFSQLLATTGAQIVGVDQSASLIAIANKEKGDNERYLIGNAERLSELHLGKFDAAYCVLAFENMKNIFGVLQGISATMKKEGMVVLVLLHPAFRIPQHSDWVYDTKTQIQYRTVGKYLSEVAIPIELHPHKSKHAGAKAATTTTFHRSLQWYAKTLRNAGFAITNLEEWISHKKSQPGPRQKAEDTARKEIPMFLALELKKV